MIDPRGPDSLVTDLRSQALCLRDALATDSDRAVLHAFEAVVRARGLSQLALDAGVHRASLMQMAAGASPADLAGLKTVIAGLIARWDFDVQRTPGEYVEKDDLESDKT